LKYAFLGYALPGALDGLTLVERAAWEADLAAFHAELGQRACVVHGAPLAESDTATTVRMDNGQASVVDGPFNGAGDLQAVLVIDVPDLDVALDLAKRSPAARIGSVEVRPLRPM